MFMKLKVKLLVLFSVFFVAGIVAVLFYIDSKIMKFQTNPKKNYHNYCAGCHGSNLEKFTNRKWVYGNSYQQIAHSIREGIINDGMPAFRATFTDQEITDLANYIVLKIERKTKRELKDGANLKKTIKSEELNFKVETYISGLEIPWAMAFLPGGEMLITERSGILYKAGRKNDLQKIEGLPRIKASGQGGLLDIKLHSNYQQTEWIYIAYSKPHKDTAGLATTAVIRAKLNGNTLEQVEEIFEALPYSHSTRHFGARIEFDGEGFLYIAIGDRGNEAQNPQSLENHLGKVHRLHDDGRIPADNPFVNVEGAIASIFTYGHRNIQGMVIHPETGQLWTHEHGPRGGDEVNILEKSKNYGWPVISHGVNYNGTIITELNQKEGMETPLHYWVPSIAPSGATFVNHKRYKGWQGDLLVGSLRFKYLHRLKIEGGKIVKEESLLKEIGRVRDVRMSPDGFLYIAVEQPGKIYRIVPMD
jgi:aldose sugar dehydrogenase